MRHIAAYSPEARGRSERVIGTLQDRLPKELADAGITTIEDANRYIAETYLPAHTQRFRVEPAEPCSAFVPWAVGDLHEILCPPKDRVVARYNTVQFGTLFLQFPLSPHHTSELQSLIRTSFAVFCLKQN